MPPTDASAPEAVGESAGGASAARAREAAVRKWAVGGGGARHDAPHWAWTDPDGEAPQLAVGGGGARHDAPHWAWTDPDSEAARLAPAAPSVATPPLSRRRRWLIRGLAPAGLLALAIALVLTLTGGEPGPATGAAALVPADALVYLHLSTDAARPAVGRAGSLLGRLPDHGAFVPLLAQRFVSVLGGSATTVYARDIRPWIGPEAAFAVLNTPGASAGSVIVAAVHDQARAAAFVRRAGAMPVGRYGGRVLWRYPSGAELTFVGTYLVVGQDASVRAAIDVGRGAVPSLASNPAYQQATGDEPDSRVLDAYISSGGVQRLLDARGGVFGEMGALLSQPSMLGAAVSVSAQGSGLGMFVHEALDSTVPGAQSARLSSFTPTLQRVLPGGSTMFFDAENLSKWGPAVLTDLARIGMLKQMPDLLRRLGGALIAEGGDVRQVLSLFSGETAVALATGSGTPALIIVTRTSDEAAARRTLASLEGPLTQAFATPSNGAGVEPEVNDVQVDGVTAHQLALGPGVTLDYAVYRGLVVVSSSLHGIGDVVARRGQLGNAPAFRAALAGRPEKVSSLGFMTSTQLLGLGEQTTLSQGAVFRALVPDLQRVQAVGMYSTRGEPDTTAELFLHIP